MKQNERNFSEQELIRRQKYQRLVDNGHDPFEITK
jgi:hypothetical protein